MSEIENWKSFFDDNFGNYREIWTGNFLFSGKKYFLLHKVHVRFFWGYHKLKTVNLLIIFIQPWHFLEKNTVQFYFRILSVWILNIASLCLGNKLYRNNKNSLSFTNTNKQIYLNLFSATQFLCPDHPSVQLDRGRDLQVLCRLEKRKRNLAALVHPHTEHVKSRLEWNRNSR